MTNVFDRGLAALRAGNLPQARKWLEAAQRAEPHNAAIALALGSVLIRQRDPSAVALHRDIVAGGLLAEALHGLAASLRMVGDHQGAAEARGLALAKFAMSPSRAQDEALEQYCAQAGIGGWCALGPDGQLLVAFAGPAQGCTVCVRLDGVAIWEAGVAQRHQVALPEHWVRCRTLSVAADGARLLGNTIDLANIVRVEGMADMLDGALVGWAWCPHDAEYDPVLTLRCAGRTIGAVVAAEPAPDIRNWRPMARPRRFRVAAEALTETDGAIEVLGRDGRNLHGAPLDPACWRQSAVYAAKIGHGTPPRTPMLAVPAWITGQRPDGGEVPGDCAVILPVHGARDMTLRCLETVRATCPAWASVIVVDDASEEAELIASLDALAAAGEITLLRHAANAGFPAAANTGLRAAAGRDAVLLNSDTLVPPGWLERLRQAAYSAADIGTVTPLSNDATLVSYPDAQLPNPIPDLEETRRLDGFAARAEAGKVVELPTAVGFCMFIKRDCLADAGLLRADVFSQGYGEENDFCLRARHLGWRHVAAANVFVGHVGGQSFGAARLHLRARNLRILNELHPGYDDLIAGFARADPLAPARRAIDAVRWAAARDGRPAVLLITHGRRGGVQRRVRERALELRAQGMRPLCLWPVASRQAGRDCVLGDGPEGGTPNLRFSVPGELEQAAALLRDDDVQRIEVHSLVGHDHRVLGLAGYLHVPYDMVIHDYASFCPRIMLVNGGNRYCGEPDVQTCEACVADHGQAIEEDITPGFLRARSAMQLAGAAAVIAPSADAAARIRRHFAGVDPVVTPWEAAPDAFVPAPPGTGRLRVCVVGALGREKGFDVLLACARDAKRRGLALDFILVGYSCDDGRLLAAGPVDITGEYAEADAVSLIRHQAADLAFLPSIWPETWSYTLSQAWEAGLRVAAFDIGAPAERIRETGLGWVLPLDSEAAVINDFLSEEGRKSLLF